MLFVKGCLSGNRRISICQYEADGPDAREWKFGWDPVEVGRWLHTEHKGARNLSVIRSGWRSGIEVGLRTASSGSVAATVAPTRRHEVCEIDDWMAMTCDPLAIQKAAYVENRSCIESTCASRLQLLPTVTHQPTNSFER
jgi:hypothetical protein